MKTDNTIAVKRFRKNFGMLKFMKIVAIREDLESFLSAELDRARKSERARHIRKLNLWLKDADTKQPSEYGQGQRSMVEGFLASLKEGSKT